MPFLIVNGLGNTLPVEQLIALRRRLAKTLSIATNTMIDTNDIYFPVDLLDHIPRTPQDGGNVIFAQINSGMFLKFEGTAKPEVEKAATGLVAEVIKRAVFSGRTVECVVQPFDTNTMTILKAEVVT